MNDKPIRDILYFEDHYLNFYNSLKPDVKKTQKTPKNEIELAEKLKKQYFDGKDQK
jgi:phage-related protein